MYGLKGTASPDHIFADGFEPVAAATAGPAAGHRVFCKLGYGPRSGDVAAFDALPGDRLQKLSAWVTTQLAPSTIDDSACEARIAAGPYTTLGKSLPTLYGEHVRGALSGYPQRYHPVAETECVRLIRAVHSRRQLFERTVEFWHDHFNVLGWDFGIAPVFVHYDRDVVRPHAFGNFRALLEAVAQSHAMMQYLDNRSSTVSGFNENFARELCELHTLGADNYYPGNNPFDVPRDAGGNPLGYCDNDVYEASRALTGWSIADGHWQFPTEVSGEFVYRDSWHDKANKLFLGDFIPANNPGGAMADGRRVLDLLCAHPGTARHLCTKLIRRFIADTPPAALLDSAATLWRQTWQAPDQIAQVLRHILTDAAVLDVWGDKRKRPFESLVQALRAADGEIQPTPFPAWSPYGDMNGLLQQAGHGMFRWPTPDGYPETKDKWQAVGVLAQTWRMLSRLPEWRAPVSGDRPFLAKIHELTLAALPTPASRTATAIVDLWLQRVLGHVPSGSGRTQLIDFMRQNAAADEPLDLVSDATDDGLPTHAGHWNGGDLKRHYTIARLRTTVGLLFCLPDFHLR